MKHTYRTIVAGALTLCAMSAPGKLEAANISPSGNLTSQTYQTDENIITGNPCVVGTGVNVVFSTDMKTYLNKGFSVKAGGIFKVTILDNDGLPNVWEMAYFGNLNQNVNGDYDNDGLTNKQELDLGTDPTLADTDGDGVDDYSEAVLKTDPLDPLKKSGRGNYYQYDSIGRIISVIKIH